MGWLKRHRKLNKPVSYVLGNQLVELHPSDDGIVIKVRRKRRRHGVKILVRELIAVADMIRRPKGWIPRVGEGVFVLPKQLAWQPAPRRRRKATITAVIERAIDLALKVRYSTRGKERFMPYERLVPRDAKLLIECERIPKDGTKKSESARTLF